LPFRAAGETPRVSPARAGQCPADRQVREQQRPAHDPAGEKRPPGAGRALAGGFGPRLAKGQRGAVAGAMAPAMAATQCHLHSGREQETHCVSPARAGQCPVDRLIREQRRPAPDPAGEKRPPWAGRALAGGFGPRLVLIPAWHCGRGDSPCQRDRGTRIARDRHSGREQETHRVSPAPARRCPVDRLIREQRRPAPDPAGGKRPPGAGRALVSMIFAGPVV
jgi:hypothetical protein